MEQEYFFSGYCRCLDNSRMVEVVAEDSHVTEVDCSFATCPYTCSCTIAQSIQQLEEGH